MTDDEEPARPTNAPRRHRDHDHRHDRSKDKDRDRSHSHQHRHRHRSRSRSRDRHHRKRSHRDDEDEEARRRRRRKSRRDEDGDGGDERRRRRRHKSRPEEEEEDVDDRQKQPNAQSDEEMRPPPPSPPALPSDNPKRDEWMKAPSADFIDYTQKGVRKASPNRSVAAKQPDYRPAIIHKNELNAQLVAGKSLDEYADGDTNGRVGIGYTFGDGGSGWRMTRLKRLYEAANEKGVTVEELALERYGSLKLFDDAREEEMELERRDMYGINRKDAKDAPSGELYAERMRKQQQECERKRREPPPPLPPPLMQQVPQAKVLDQTGLNRMRAALMKAQLRGDPKAAKMEEEYNAALEASRQGVVADDTVVLSAMDTRQLAGLGTRVGREVVEGKKGKLMENGDMTIDDMVREEKITRGQGAGRQMAERISRDAKFNVCLPPPPPTPTLSSTSHH